MPKISIIVPIYNAEMYLEESVKSILNQTFSDFELILVNDGSKDNSQRICEEFAQKDNRIKIINSQNEGSGKARNKGIATASGEYCYFPDADDVLLPDALDIMNKEIEKQRADLYVFGYIITQRTISAEKKKARVDLYISGDEVRKNYENYMVEGQTYIQGAPWNKLFKTENIKDNNIEYPSLKRNQDEVFIVRYMNTVKNVKFCNEYIYKYYANDLSEEWKKFPRNYFDIRTKVHQEFRKYIISWNTKNNRTKSLMNFSYLYNLLKCFEYMFNPKWQMNKKQREDYIKTCADYEEVIQALEYLTENEKDVRQIMKEFNIKSFKINLFFYQIKLIKKGRVKKLYNISKLMVNLRDLYRKMQYSK